MKRLIVRLAVVVVVLLGAQNVKGAIVFTEDVTFVDGDEYWSVQIREDAHAEVLGGLFRNQFQLCDNSTATLLGGNFRGSFSVTDSSQASMHSGAFINTYIFMGGSANLDIFGGKMPDRYLDATSFGGDPLVTFHGYGLTLDPTGGKYNDGRVTGVFADGSAFGVDLYGDETPSHITLAEIPEPSTIIIWSALCLTFAGGAWWRRRRR